jgi:hypothetical protein
MAKSLIDIRDNIYDVWELRSLEKGQRYNSDFEEVEHTIVMNRDAIQTNYANVVFPFDSEEERDEYLKNLKIRLGEFESIMFV